MQTPREKAKQTVEMYLNLHSHIHTVDCAKTCAILSIDLIIKAIEEDFSFRNDSIIEWYEEVKNQIENLPT